MRASSLATAIRFVPAALLLLLAAGCDRPEAPPAGRSEVGPYAGPAPRIVSLSPAISRTLVDLGLTDRIVGRSRFCDFLPDEIPAVGDLHDVDLERLIVIDPSHVLVQPPGAGVDPRLRDACEQFGWQLHAWPGIDRLDDIRRLTRDLPEVLASEGSLARIRLSERAESLCAALDAALAPEPGAWNGTTVLAYGTDPVGIHGRDTFLVEILERLGARSAVETSAWATMTLEDLTRLDPGAIIMVRPADDAGMNPVEAAGPLATLDVRAVRTGRLAVLAHDEAWRPSTGVIEVADAMRRLLRELAAKRGP